MYQDYYLDKRLGARATFACAICQCPPPSDPSTSTLGSTPRSCHLTVALQIGMTRCCCPSSWGRGFAL
eukprot:1802431-Amphidinium_carterae.1